MSHLDFWSQEAKNLFWAKPFTQVHDGRFAFGHWFKDGMLNASWNCLDRHVQAGRGSHAAIVFESETGVVKKLSYEELLDLTCDIATILHQQGVSVGDRVAIIICRSFQKPLLPCWPLPAWRYSYGSFWRLCQRRSLKELATARRWRLLQPSDPKEKARYSNLKKTVVRRS